MNCEIADRFFGMMEAIHARQKVPQEYVPGQMLYQSEMDFITAIYENPHANVSLLSKQEGVTKSAITQMSNRLLEKGLVEKYCAPNNKKEKYFRLTVQGEEARLSHLEHHRENAEEIRSYLCGLDDEDKAAIVGFMEKMTEHMPVCAFSCSCGQHCVTEDQGEKCET